MTLAELAFEIEAMVEDIRGLNDPKVECPDCKGTGILPHFMHVAEGVCFACEGEGEVDAAMLPAGMLQCNGCDRGIASGLVYPCEGAVNGVCPSCFEHITGHERFGCQCEECCD